jgi:hypothetical protein
MKVTPAGRQIDSFTRSNKTRLSPLETFASYVDITVKSDEMMYGRSLTLGERTVLKRQFGERECNQNIFIIAKELK